MCHRWLTTHIISQYFLTFKMSPNYQKPKPCPLNTLSPPPPHNTFFQLSFRPQFHDKMDPLLETLEGAVQRLRQPPSVAAEVDKIREQLAEHRAQGLELDKLLPSFSALCARGEELIGRAAHNDPAAQGEWLGMCLTVNDNHVKFKMTYRQTVHVLNSVRGFTQT